MRRAGQVRRRMTFLAASVNLWYWLVSDRSNLRSKIECDAM